MSAEEYWHGDPELMQAYRKAYRIRKEERNWELWLQGLYFCHALNVALSNAFDDKAKAEYMSEPLKIFPPTEEELEEKSRKEAIELKRRLDAFAERFNGRSNSK